MKRITLITCSKFWRSVAGSWTRTRALVDYLGERSRLIVVFLGSLDGDEEIQVKRAFKTIEFYPLARSAGATRADDIRLLSDCLTQSSPADAFLIDKTEYSYLLAALPKTGLRIVDTHDLLSEKALSLARYGQQARHQIDARSEKLVLDQYDLVMCIQAEDYATVKSWLGPAKPILAQHPVTATAHYIREKARTIGFVASPWTPNVDGLRWFLDEVMPRLVPETYELDVYGTIARAFRNETHAKVKFHGFAPSLDACYRDIDIAINPVRFGSGLKIKSVEAIAHGRPLVTSSEGARGITELDGSALFIADQPTAVARLIERLLANRELRQAASEAGIRHARKHLTPTACFGALLQRIEAL